MTWSFDPIRQAVKAGRTAGDIHEQIVVMISSGADRDAIFAALTDFRAELRGAGDETSEDIVLDVMDFFVGWCRPSSRL